MRTAREKPDEAAAAEREDSARRRGSGSGESDWRNHWERVSRAMGLLKSIGARWRSVTARVSEVQLLGRDR